MVNSSTTQSNSGGSVFTPDSSSPLFIHSSDVPGTCLVSVPFNGTAYGGWKRDMVVCLSAKNKIGLVDGSCKKPDDDSPQLQHWNRVNNLVISWLTSSVSPEIASSIKYSTTAESIWKQLETRYGVINGTKVFEIKKELASTQQGSLDIASYFNNLKRLWDELEVMRVARVNKCCCAAKAELQKEIEEDKLHQFLMGLNETYITVRSNLLMLQPLPSLDSAYSVLLQDEAQRQIQSNLQFNQESSSFNAASTRKPYPNTEGEKLEEKTGNEESPEAQGLKKLIVESPLTPPAPITLKWKRRLIDECDDELKGLARKLWDEFEKVAEEEVIAARTRNRRKEGVVEVVNQKSKGDKLKKGLNGAKKFESSKRYLPR